MKKCMDKRRMPKSAQLSYVSEGGEQKLPLRYCSIGVGQAGAVNATLENTQ